MLGSDARLLRLARLAALWLVPLTLGIVFVVFGTGPEPQRNWLGDMLGSDFTQVWVAGTSALQGRAGEPYDLPVHLENLKAAFGPDCRFAWHYPPVFLLPAAAMALLPPQGAFLLWTALSLGLFALTLRLASGRGDAVMIGLAHPLVFCNLTYGQNGLFTASLLTLGALLVDRRPWLAGLCFGLVAYKPQLAGLAPLLLLVTGRRQALAACIVTVLALCLASLAAFGWAPWQGFLDTLAQTNRIILRNAAAGLDINASAFGAVRLAGGSMEAAWALQVAVSGLAIWFAWRAWTVCADPALRTAALLSAAPMISPYVPLYDLAPLVPATMLLAIAAHRAGGLRAYERWLLIAAPATALLRPAMGATGFSFGLVLGLATLACVAARALPGLAGRSARAEVEAA
ncbi:glycosyltransferase family 87 protein [Methylobacterium trifolii]|nr:glycosyltransferase family 87 protein [Methylobacterium trifolii]